MDSCASQTVVAMHQPNFMPWMGYFHKMISSDIFIVMDNVQYIKGSWINRVQIKTPQGSLWITVPVKITGNSFNSINAIEICNHHKWSVRILKTLDQNYHKCIYWQQHAPFLEETFKKSWSKLIDLNLHILHYIRDCLGVSTRLILLSSLGVTGRKSELIAKACCAVGGQIYLSGSQAAEYNDENIYTKYGLKLVYQKFRHPNYPQRYGAFISGLSVIDLLLNCGFQSAEYIKQCGY